MNSDIAETESEPEIFSEDNGFECIKCGFEYNSYAESEYMPCTKCIIMSCKNCRLICGECDSYCCFRCSSYLDCCDVNKCHDCYFFCENHSEYECIKCTPVNTCEYCEYTVCKDFISTEHKNNIYCTDCAYEFCTLCNENIFIFEGEDEEEIVEDDYFPNPCKNCLKDINEVILKTDIELPDEIVKNIISYVVTE